MRISKVISGKKGELVVVDHEGNKWKRSGGTVAWRCNNPGNLKDGPFSRSMGSLGKDHIGHAVFPTVEHGEQAHYTLLFRPASPYWNLTISDALKRYAPASDGNDPQNYINYICGKVGCHPTTKIKTLTHTEKLDMMKYMAVFEGWKQGKDINL